MLYLNSRNVTCYGQWKHFFQKKLRNIECEFGLNLRSNRIQEYRQLNIVNTEN